MYSTTDAIVLSLQPHTDRAHILHAYTRASGRINYKVFGLGKHHAAGLYSPLSLIQITANHTSAQMPTIKEAVSLSTNGRQSSIDAAIFYGDYDCDGVCASVILLEALRGLGARAEIYIPSRQDEGYGLNCAAVERLAKKLEQLGFAIPEDHSLSSLTREIYPQTRSERQEQLRALCAYFAEHVETWEDPKSLDILMEVFD